MEGSALWLVGIAAGKLASGRENNLVGAWGGLVDLAASLSLGLIFVELSLRLGEALRQSGVGLAAPQLDRSPR